MQYGGLGGELFRSLGHHAVRAHQLSADAYRAVFGLRASTSLIERGGPSGDLTTGDMWGRAAYRLASTTPSPTGGQCVAEWKEQNWAVSVLAEARMTRIADATLRDLLDVRGVGESV